MCFRVCLAPRAAHPDARSHSRVVAIKSRARGQKGELFANNFISRGRIHNSCRFAFDISKFLSLRLQLMPLRCKGILYTTHQARVERERDTHQCEESFFAPFFLSLRSLATTASATSSSVYFWVEIPQDCTRGVVAAREVNNKQYLAA